LCQIMDHSLEQRSLYSFPAPNGSAENAMKSFFFRILNDKINTMIQRYILMTHRNTPHWITVDSPSYKMFGIQVETRLDQL